MPSCLTDCLPYSLLTIKNTFSIRNSQEKLIELAQEHLNKKNYQDAIFFYKKVLDSMTLENEKNAILADIDKVLELMDEDDYLAGKKSDKDKASEKQEQNTDQNQKAQPACQEDEGSFLDINQDGLNIRVDNITISGVQLKSGEKALELLENMLQRKKSGQESAKQLEAPKIEAKIPDQDETPELLSKEKRLVEEKIFQEVMEERNFKPRKVSSNITDEDEKKHQELLEEEKKAQEDSTAKKNIGSQVFEDVPLIDPGMEKYYRKSEKKKAIQEIDQEGNLLEKIPGESGISSSVKTMTGDFSGLSQEQGGTNFNPKLDMSLNNGQPIKVENVAPQKKLQKVSPIQLTYNFQNVFYNKFYLKYSDMFNEAARLVRDKKLDTALEYYNTLLDQRLPETMRLMVEQNVEDLKNTIKNTFKYADTIVEMDESGKLVRLDDIDTVKVFEEKKKGKDDVFFND